MEKIRCERDRMVTFNKRKQGLFKKAFELSVLCDCDVALLVFGPNNTLSEYASSNMELLLKKYARMCTDPHDKKNNEDLYEQHFDGGRQYDGDDDDGLGHDDDEDDDEDDLRDEYDEDENGEDDGIGSPRKRMRRMLMRRVERANDGSVPSCLGGSDAVTDRRLDALSRVPLSPRREAAFTAILSEFNDLLMIQKVSKMTGQNVGGVKQGGSPIKGMRDLSIAVPDCDNVSMQPHRAEEQEGAHRRTKGFLDHLDVPSPSDLLSYPNNMFSSEPSPMAGVADDAFADLVVTGRRVSYNLPSAVGLSPDFEKSHDLNLLFTPKPGGQPDEIFMEHHGGSELSNGAEDLAPDVKDALRDDIKDAAATASMDHGAEDGDDRDVPPSDEDSEVEDLKATLPDGSKDGK